MGATGIDDVNSAPKDGALVRVIVTAKILEEIIAAGVAAVPGPETVPGGVDLTRPSEQLVNASLSNPLLTSFAFGQIHKWMKLVGISMTLFTSLRDDTFSFMHKTIHRKQLVFWLLASVREVGSLVHL